MREVLRAEFGDLAPLVRRMPRPSLARPSDLWLVLAAFGAGWLATALMGLLSSLIVDRLDPRTSDPEVRQMLLTIWRPLIQIAGGAAAVAVARSGGWRAVALLAGAQALLLASRYVRELRAETLLRERDLPPLGSPQPPEIVLGWTPYLVGALLGLWLARWIARSATDGNPLLESLGARILIPSVSFGVLGVAIPLADERLLPFVLAVTAAAAIAAGSVVGVRADRPLVTALFAAIVIVGAWIWPLGVSQLGIQIDAGRPLGETLLIASPAFEAVLVAVAAIVVGSARRMRRSLPT